MLNREMKKYVLTKNNKIRQYHSIKHLEEQPKWLKQNDKDIKVNLYSKMITLVLTKYGLLDPQVSEFHMKQISLAGMMR